MRVGNEHWGWRSGSSLEERKSIKMGLKPRKNSVEIKKNFTSMDATANLLNELIAEV